MICSSCNKSKPNDSFHWKIRDVRRNTICKSCQSKYKKKYYVKNKDKICYQAAKRRKRWRNEIRDLVLNYLLTKSCVDCGEDNPVVLDFDHRNPTNKKFNICNAIRQGYSWTTIKAEIDKCDVRCSNCHRKRTSKVLGAWRYKYGG